MRSSLTHLVGWPHHWAAGHASLPWVRLSRHDYPTVPSELQKDVFDGHRPQSNNAMYVLSSVSPARISGIHDLTIPEQCDCPFLVFLGTRGDLG